MTYIVSSWTLNLCSINQPVLFGHRCLWSVVPEWFLAFKVWQNSCKKNGLYYSGCGMGRQWISYSIVTVLCLSDVIDAVSSEDVTKSAHFEPHSMWNCRHEAQTLPTVYSRRTRFVDIQPPVCCIRLSILRQYGCCRLIRHGKFAAEPTNIPMHLLLLWPSYCCCYSALQQITQSVISHFVDCVGFHNRGYTLYALLISVSVCVVYFRQRHTIWVTTSTEFRWVLALYCADGLTALAWCCQMCYITCILLHCSYHCTEQNNRGEGPS